MTKNINSDLMHDLVLPTLLFAVLGGMVWAVRGCSGYGAVNGCTFAGVTWGAAWWYLSRDRGPDQSRRYSSGWIILALTIGIGLSGSRGWMQWPSFFDGQLQVNTGKGVFEPVSRNWGFMWLFIAGVPWAGIGACVLAWTASKSRTRWWQWGIRIACAIAGAFLLRQIFTMYPHVFLPLYKNLQAEYQDAVFLHPRTTEFPNLRRLYSDSQTAFLHLGFFLGCLAYEMGRRDWKNATLISTVGVLNGIGWALCQNWKWAAHLWPTANFNFWRCWESSGGISIGIAYGVAYYLVNRRMTPEERAARPEPSPLQLNMERLGLALGLIWGLGYSIKNGLKGWANIYIGNEEYWSRVFWSYTWPLMLLLIAATVAFIVIKPIRRGFRGDLFPHAYAIIWLVLIVQNTLAQLITGPHNNWNEVAFSLYYILLFFISAVIVYHYYVMKKYEAVEYKAEVAA